MNNFPQSWNPLTDDRLIDPRTFLNPSHDIGLHIADIHESAKVIKTNPAFE